METIPKPPAQVQVDLGSQSWGSKASLCQRGCPSSPGALEVGREAGAHLPAKGEGQVPFPLPHPLADLVRPDFTRKQDTGLRMCVDWLLTDLTTPSAEWPMDLSQ